MDNKVVLIGALTAAGLGGWWLLSRSQTNASGASATDPASTSYPTDTTYGGGFGPGGAFTPLTPDTGTGGASSGSPLLPPGPAGDSPVAIHLSPSTEAGLLQQNQALNDQVDATNRVSQGIQAAAATAAAAPFAIYGAVKYGRALTSSLQGAGRSAAGAIENAAARLAAPGATMTDVAALTPAGVAVGIAGGAALGLAGVAVLKQTGALDRVASAGKSLNNATDAGVQRIIKTAALPLSTLGAFATGIVGYGGVAGNVRAALKGTFLGDWFHA